MARVGASKATPIELMWPRNLKGKRKKHAVQEHRRTCLYTCTVQTSTIVKDNLEWDVGQLFHNTRGPCKHITCSFKVILLLTTN